MQLVSDLSKGVADEFREKRKGKLKRTFVQASDAAGAKIKGSSKEQEQEPQDKVSKRILDAQKALFSCFVHSNVVKPPETGDFPGLIIYENCKPDGTLETCPINILTQTVHKNKDWKNIKFDFPPEKITTDLLRCCVISIDGKVLSSAKGETQKEAKLNAAIEGLKILRKSCFTIQAKHAFFSDNPVVGKDLVTKTTKTENPLPQDNIGCKMMQKMGWTGAGLGKLQQGIETPIQASVQNVQRAGFGGTDQKKLHGNCRKILKDYIASGSDHDLVFSPDFTSDERKVLHQLAQHLNLKTKSYGKNEERRLVICKVLPLPVMLETLLARGGETEKYLLIHPGTDKCLEVIANLEDLKIQFGWQKRRGDNFKKEYRHMKKLLTALEGYKKVNHQCTSKSTQTDDLSGIHEDKIKSTQEEHIFSTVVPPDHQGGGQVFNQ